MLVSLCKDLKKGETGLRANCLPNLLEQELQRNPFRRILLSPQQPFDGSLNRKYSSKIQSHPSPKYTFEIAWFLLLWFFTQNKKASEIIYRGCPKFNAYSVFACTGRVYDFDVFQTLSQCFYHSGVRKTDHHFTFKSSTVGSQTMQPFICCIIEQITLETSKKCINNFVFCSVLSSKDGVRCYATLLLVFPHLGNTVTRCMLY